MLIRFEVANFRSILDPVELSMVAIDRDRAEARAVPNLGESLLPVAAIYGPNASGKSNVLAALAWLTTAVRESLRSWDDEIPVEPFAFAEGHDRPMEFTVELIIAGVRFEYVVELRKTELRHWHCSDWRTPVLMMSRLTNKRLWSAISTGPQKQSRDVKSGSCTGPPASKCPSISPRSQPVHVHGSTS